MYAIGSVPSAPNHAQYPLHHIGCVVTNTRRHDAHLVNAPFRSIRLTASNESTVHSTMTNALQQVASTAGGSIYGPVYALVMRNLDKQNTPHPHESPIDIIMYLPGISSSGQRITIYDSLGRSHRWLMRLILSPQFTFITGDANKWCSSKCLYDSRGPSAPSNPAVPFIGTVRASSAFKRYYMTTFSYFAFLMIAPKIDIGDYYPADYYPCGTKGGGKRMRVAEYAPEQDHFYAFHVLNPSAMSVPWQDNFLCSHILPQGYPLYSGARYALKSTNNRYICILEHNNMTVYDGAYDFFQRAREVEQQKYMHVGMKNCNKDSNYCYAIAMMLESSFYSKIRRSYGVRFNVSSGDYMNQLVLTPGLLQLTAESSSSSEIILWKVKFSTDEFVQPYSLMLTNEGDLVIFDGMNRRVHSIGYPPPSAATNVPPSTPTLLRSSTLTAADLVSSGSQSGSSSDGSGGSGSSQSTSQAAAAVTASNASAGNDQSKCPAPPFITK